MSVMPEKPHLGRKNILTHFKSIKYKLNIYENDNH